MRACVRFRLPGGQTADACPGDLVGRLWLAAVRLDDPRLSEAHALVSLRGTTLQAMALRGALAVGGVAVTEVVLVPGLVVELAVGLVLEVVDVELPDHALALAGFGPRPQVLVASVYTILAGPPAPPRAEVPSGRAGAPLEHGARLDGAAGRQRPGAAGGGHDARRCGGPGGRGPGRGGGRGAAGDDAPRSVDPRVRIVTRYDSVQLHRDALRWWILAGGAARLVSELAAMGGLAGWEAIAGELWPGEADRVLLRQKWDRTLQTLRGKIRNTGCGRT